MTASTISGPRLILASASPRRRELLGSLGLPFDIVVPRIEEDETAGADPKALVRHNAALKAAWVSERHPEAFVLGADTTVSVDRLVLNKPADLDAARAMLRRLSGRAHTVYTGLALRRKADGLALDEIVASEVLFKSLDDAAIDRYIGRVSPLDKAGAYAIQEGTDLIVSGWHGSFTNIVGLPLEETKQILTRCGLYRD